MPGATSRFPPLADGIRLGLGGAPLGNLFAAITESDAQAVLGAALAGGCRTLDTAPHYGNGLSEHRIGEALRRHGPAVGDGVALSSKVGRLLHPDARAAREQNGYADVLPFVQAWDYSAAGVRRSVFDSLQRLGRARLDAVFVHDCDAGVHGADYPRVLQQVCAEALPELRRLQREGLVRAVGLGVNDVQVCLDVLARADLDCLLLAGRYSLLDQGALPQLLPLCQRRGVRIALGGVFNSGILATGVGGREAPRFNYAAAPAPLVERVARIEAVCAAHAVPLRAAALQFPLAQAAIEIVVVGAQSVDHWHDAVHMMAHPIPPAFWAALRSDGLLAEDVPTPGDT